MTLFQAAVWGVTQGLTEFLPVSSSGHLVLLPWLVGWQAPSLTYDVVVHLGTLVAIVGYFWGDIRDLICAAWWLVWRRGPRPEHTKLVWLILISAIPAALLGFLLEDLLESAFASPLAVSCFLIVTGLSLFISERLGRGERSLEQMGPGDALLVGLVQSLALLPGISRSGVTIAAGLLRGVRREAAARFSFLMVIPVVLGATLYEVLKLARGTVSDVNVATLLVGFFCAALSGYLAISFLLRYLRRKGLLPFAIYCWGIGSVGLLVHLFS